MYNKVHNQIVSFIWGIADDVLRDVFVRGAYSVKNGHLFRMKADTSLENFYGINLKIFLFFFQKFSHRFSFQFDAV